jgi:nitroreductase
MENTPFPSASTLTQLVRSRRTVYAFRPERAPRDALNRALDAARWAPNHRLTELDLAEEFWCPTVSRAWGYLPIHQGCKPFRMITPSSAVS